jgi:Ca2+-binding EF-hand superfamily protein
LTNAYRKAEYDISDDEIKTIFGKIKPVNREEINWSSFLFASFDRTMFNRRSLKHAFRFLDSE